MINPINHSNTLEKAQKYKIEPYSIAADVYSNKDLAGRGGWSLYTGSSSWFYKVTVEYILGLKIKNGYLYVEPCIDKNWKEYEIRYKYETSIYQIKVKKFEFKKYRCRKIYTKWCRNKRKKNIVTR